MLTYPIFLKSVCTRSIPRRPRHQSNRLRVRPSPCVRIYYADEHLARLDLQGPREGYRAHSDHVLPQGEEVRADMDLLGLISILYPCLARSAKKLNSHRWALEAFAPQLDPNVVMLIDVGTKPGDKSLYHLWKAFDLNSNGEQP